MTTMELKPIAPDGVEISREDELRVEAIYYANKFPKFDGLGQDHVNEFIIDSYGDAVLA